MPIPENNPEVAAGLERQLYAENPNATGTVNWIWMTSLFLASGGMVALIASWVSARRK